MSFESEIKELRMKRIGEGVKTRKLTDIVKTDIAPLREKEDTSGLFKWGTLDDGFDSLGTALALGGTATLGDISAGILQGAGGLVEGVTDLGAYAVAGILHATGKHSAAWDVKNLAKEDTVAGFMNDLREKSGISEYSFLGDFGYDVASGAGYITGLAAGGALAKAVGVTGKGLSAVSKIIMGLSGMGSGMSEAYSNGATDGEAAAYGAMSAGAEVLSEMMFSGLGGAFQKLGVGTGLIDLDDVITKKLTKNITNNAVKNLLQLGIKASGEGIEEVVSGFLSSLAKKTTYKSEEDYGKILADEDLLKQAFSGFLVSLISQSGDVMSSTSQGREFVTGLTDNEQKVVDKVYENRVTEAEKNGKLTSKEKNKIYDEVMKDLKDGGIDIETINDVLGVNDSYKAYTEAVKNREALKDELKTLREMESGKRNDFQEERLNELKEMNLSDDTQINKFRDSFYSELSPKIKDSYLAESYNERARRNEKFTADLTKYKGKQAEIVQKAIDSGFLNNTRKTHALVDLIAKVGGDKDIGFDFTNNEKLKNSGFAVEGRIINGYVTKDGVTVNINSKKALNSVVGHEITHVLEGTELYNELRNAVYEYSKTKGDYDGRRANIEKLYEGIKDADVDAELTADLIGDYLFTDTDFVRSLSTKNRNLFEKLFDEIKYLCKVATAGSKEARQLEAVKKAFQEAYRVSGKSVTDDSNMRKDVQSEEQPTEVKLGAEKITPEQAQVLNIMSSNIVSEARKNNIPLDQYYAATEEVNAYNPTKADVKTIADALEPIVKQLGNENYNSYLDTIRSYAESGGAKYSLAVTDTDYLDAVNRGDIETAQRMVDEAAYTKNYVVAGYHGTPNGGFTKFGGHKTRNGAKAAGSYWFAEEIDHAKVYKSYPQNFPAAENPMVYNVYLDIGNWADIGNGRVEALDYSFDGKGAATKELRAVAKAIASKTQYKHSGKSETARVRSITQQLTEIGRNIYADFIWQITETQEFADLCKKEGLDSVVAWEEHKKYNSNGERETHMVKTYGVFSPEQIKSADPITYDDNGNVIPLSERFKSKNDDIRYSLSAEQENFLHQNGTNYNLGIDNKQNSVYNINDKNGGIGYVRTDEFRKLQAESQGMPDEEWNFYLRGGENEAVRRRISNILQRQMESVSRSGGFNNGVLKLSGKENVFNIYEGVNGSLFHDVFEISRKYLKNGELVDLHEVKTTEDGIGYDDCNNYLSEDGLSGFSITPEGDLISVFNASQKGGFLRAISGVVKEKAKTLDCFASPNQNLMGMYQKVFGFKAASVMDYNMEYDHDNIAENHDMPKVAFMVNTESDVELKYFTKDEYDEAVTYRNSFVEQAANNRAASFMPETGAMAPAKDSLSFEDEHPTRVRGGIYGEDVALEAPVAENIAPVKETVVEEIPIAPIRSDTATANTEIISNGTKVKVSDRDNVGTVRGYNPETKEYTVFFRGKSGTATKTFPASMVSSLNPAPSVDQATSYTKSRIGTSEGEKKKPKSVLEWFRRNFVDKFSVFEDISLKTGNRAVMDKAHTMLLSRQKAQYIIENGDADKGVKALADIREAVKKDGHYDDFVDYMFQKHNIDRMSIKSNAMNSVNHLEPKFGHLGKDQIYAIANTEITPTTTPKTVQTINEAKEYLSALNTKNKAVFDDSVTADVSRKAVNDYEKKYPQFKKFADDVYAYNKYLLNMLVDEGILTQDTADLWANMYPNHVPIVRVDKEGNPVVSLGKRGAGVNAPIKKATGGNGVIQDLFKSLADRTAQTIKAVDTDRFGHELRQTINANVVQDQNNTGDVDEILNSPDKILTPGLDGNSATFGIYENGKRVDFEISEEMYNALKPVSDDLAREIPVISTLSKARRAMLTSLSPMFAIKNPIRDLQDVFVNSKHPVETYKNLPRAIKELAKNEGYAAEYAKNGGISGEAYDSDTKAFKEAKKGIMKYVGIPIDKLKGAGEFVETAPRLAEYIASRESGESVEASMLDAARVTTNFVAGGDVTKFLNRNGFTFLNASVQGAAQQVRNVREAKANGVKGMLTLGAKTMAAGLPLLIANALIWGDDEDYEELPSYIKDNYYIIAKFGDQFVRIPKGRAIAVIQKAFDSMGDVITGNDEVDYDTFGELLWNNFVDTFKLGISNLAPNNPIDNNIIAPIVQAHTGEAWYGDDIVPERLQDLPAGEQYDENIDLLSKWLGEKTNLSPYKINYLLDQYTGAFGDFALPMLTPKAESDAGVLAPFKNEFVVDSTVKNKNATNFFNKVDELKVKSNSAKATDSDILKSKYMDAINSELSELYKQKRNVQNSTLSDKQKYAAVKALQQQINDLCKEGLESYKNVIIDGKYATVADMHFRYTDDGKWSRIDDEQLEKQKTETARLGITPADYWRNYTLSNVVGENYKTYSSEIKDITSDKNANGDTVKDSRKKKVVAYINGLNVDYGEKLLIYKTEYPADDSYNYEIVDYLNSRDDLTTNDIRAILGRLGFDIDEDGRVSWD